MGRLVEKTKESIGGPWLLDAEALVEFDAKVKESLGKSCEAELKLELAGESRWIGKSFAEAIADVNLSDKSATSFTFNGTSKTSGVSLRVELDRYMGEDTLRVYCHPEDDPNSAQALHKFKPWLEKHEPPLYLRLHSAGKFLSLLLGVVVLSFASTLNLSEEVFGWVFFLVVALILFVILLGPPSILCVGKGRKRLRLWRNLIRFVYISFPLSIALPIGIAIYQHYQKQ